MGCEMDVLLYPRSKAVYLRLAAEGEGKGKGSYRGSTQI